jgi:hypothetical protein
MLTGKRLAPFSVALLIVAAAGFVVFSCRAYGVPPAIPKIGDSAGWQLSEACRVYKFGILTDPDCDILSGEGIAIQITRIRLLNLQPGQDNRTTVGIEFRPDHGNWYFSSPYVALLIAGKSFAPPDIDEGLVFEKGGRRIFPERLQLNQQRYQLPPGEKRFFRLRFAVPQNELRNGFALQVTGLQKEGAAVPVPILKLQFH